MGIVVHVVFALALAFYLPAHACWAIPVAHSLGRVAASISAAPRERAHQKKSSGQRSKKKKNMIDDIFAAYIYNKKRTWPEPPGKRRADHVRWRDLANWEQCGGRSL
jgi:hypothetical protein